jgi:hypothetical protein
MSETTISEKAHRPSYWDQGEEPEFVLFLRQQISNCDPGWMPPDGTGPWEPARLYETLLDLYEHGEPCVLECLPHDPSSRWEVMGVVGWLSNGEAGPDAYSTVWELYDVYELGKRRVKV